MSDDEIDVLNEEVSHLKSERLKLIERVEELMDAVHVARGALFCIGTGYSVDVAATLLSVLEPGYPEKPRLKTRPVAFRVQGEEVGEWLLYDNEAVARQEAEARDVQYQGLYVRDGTPINL